MQDAGALHGTGEAAATVSDVEERNRQRSQGESGIGMEQHQSCFNHVALGFTKLPTGALIP